MKNATIIGVAAAVACLAGCSATQVPPAAPAPASASGTPVAPVETVSAAAPSASTGQAPPAAPEPNVSASTSASPSPSPALEEQPVAVRPGSLNGTLVKAYVYPVHRGAELATANILVKSDDPDMHFTLSSTFSDGDPEVSASTKEAVDGFRLVDTKAKKAYLPATNGSGSCLCTPIGSALYLYTSQVWITVVFAAPPADVTAMDLVMPVFGTVSNAPLV